MTNTKTSNAKSTDHTAKSAKTTKPWEQQPGESTLLYSYYQLYQDLPTHIRTVKKTWETLKEKDKHLNLNYLQQVAHQHQWKQRVSGFDKRMAQLMVTSKESNIKEMNDKHFNLGKTCIDSLLSDIEDPDLDEVPIDKRAYVKQALIRGMEGAVRIQRLALGESTSNTKQVNEGINNLMMVLTDSKKQLQKQEKKDVIDIEGEVIRSTK
jgi:hypothetical protein